ncbi:MAG: 16S rRNA (guanine(966)-N(2))-methyltransferase RsmD [Myxococcaceae bacterium]|nr:MAG: 16S rRNA (guanine(966)-N(2))-methyltransferase RsmD [Myxococcaceae bacterium]
MRIVAGTHRGRPLAGPKSSGLRPTADRVRESLFNLLGQFFAGGEVLDLYAGTGALAFEALSRGMHRAVLVDRGAESARLVQENARALGMESAIELLRMPVARAVPRLASEGRRFALVFADPPYAEEAVVEVVRTVGEGRLLDEGGTLVVEHGRREVAPDMVAGLQRVESRRFGDTVVSLYRSATVP